MAVAQESAQNFRKKIDPQEGEMAIRPRAARSVAAGSSPSSPPVSRCASPSVTVWPAKCARQRFQYQARFPRQTWRRRAGFSVCACRRRGKSPEYQFCPDCGTKVYYRSTRRQLVAIPVGGFCAQGDIRSRSSQSIESRRNPWVQISADVERMDQGRARTTTTSRSRSTTTSSLLCSHSSSDSGWRASKVPDRRLALTRRRIDLELHRVVAIELPRHIRQASPARIPASDPATPWRASHSA